MRGLFLITALLCLSRSAFAGDTWTQFRGPNGDGHSDASELPLTWDAEKNIVWKAPIHDRGWCSPVIWHNQIWMTTATADGRKLFAVCVDRESGQMIHDLHVFDVDEPEHIAPMNSYASPTSAIEEGRAYVHYGTYGTACIDTTLGTILWTRRDLKCDHHEGAGSSPMLVDNLLVFNVDGRDVQYVVALDKATGQTVWKTNRSPDFTSVNPSHRKCYSMPILVDVDGTRQLVSVGAGGVMGYDIQSGKELWTVRHRGWSVAPRPVFGHGLIYMVNDYDHPELWAVQAGGAGDVTSSHISWKLTRTVPNRPSPVLVDDLLFLVSSDGVVTSLDAKTGQIVTQKRIGSKFSAAPVYAAGRLYFFDESSVATVIEPTRDASVLAISKLNDEQMMASPAVAGKALYVRTLGYLYRIEERK